MEAADRCPGLHAQPLRQDGCKVSCGGSTVGDSGDRAGNEAESASGGSKPGQSWHGCLVHPGPWQHLCLLLFLSDIEQFENCLLVIPALSAEARNECGYHCNWE